MKSSRGVSFLIIILAALAVYGCSKSKKDISTGTAPIGIKPASSHPVENSSYVVVNDKGSSPPRPKKRTSYVFGEGIYLQGQIEAGKARLFWFEVPLPGDYNLDGIISAADISPKAFNFGKDLKDPWNLQEPPPYDYLQFIDKEGNGSTLIDAGDIKPIGFNFGDELSGFRVQRADGITDPPVFQYIMDPANPSAKLLVTGVIPGAYLPRSYQLNDDTVSSSNTYRYRVIPYYTKTDTEGAPSPYITLRIAAGEPTYWTGKEGVQVAVGRDRRVILGWDDAVSPEGNEIEYLVYYDNEPAIPTGLTPQEEEAWLARAVAPVASTWVPERNPDGSFVDPSDPRNIALNPTNNTDEIPLQVVSLKPAYAGGIAQPILLPKEDQAYDPYNPGGIPAEPCYPIAYDYPQVRNVAAIPDSITSPVPEDQGASEPNLQNNTDYTFLIRARDTVTSATDSNRLQRAIIVSRWMTQRWWITPPLAALGDGVLSLRVRPDGVIWWLEKIPEFERVIIVIGGWWGDNMLGVELTDGKHPYTGRFGFDEGVLNFDRSGSPMVLGRYWDNSTVSVLQYINWGYSGKNTIVEKVAEDDKDFIVDFREAKIFNDSSGNPILFYARSERYGDRRLLTTARRVGAAWVYDDLPIAGIAGEFGVQQTPSGDYIGIWYDNSTQQRKLVLRRFNDKETFSVESIPIEPAFGLQRFEIGKNGTIYYLKHLYDLLSIITDSDGSWNEVEAFQHQEMFVLGTRATASEFMIYLKALDQIEWWKYWLVRFYQGRVYSEELKEIKELPWKAVPRGMELDVRGNVMLFADPQPEQDWQMRWIVSRF